MARVLVVDDDDIVSDVVGYKLSSMGHDVYIASDGEAGLDAARSEQFDLVLLDLLMPRMSGLEVCRALRAEGSDIPIIMLTGKVLEDDVEAGFSAGADDYITKPISLKELASRVRAQLQRVRT